MFLIVVDAHSKWMKVELVPAATSAHTIQKLQAMFTTHGPPELLVSDNGTAFTSADFQEFLSRNGLTPDFPAIRIGRESCTNLQVQHAEGLR